MLVKLASSLTLRPLLAFRCDLRIYPVDVAKLTNITSQRETLTMRRLRCYFAEELRDELEPCPGGERVSCLRLVPAADRIGQAAREGRHEGNRVRSASPPHHVGGVLYGVRQAGSSKVVADAQAH
ncbi:hypothetical protein ACQP25_06800 [Microtetraspora malaysiensis]|uniref:hypothetical protein n=1 Tax=Microtetraspora malaysiensis TaxID=161358 RepID=UPI003D9128B6